MINACVSQMKNDMEQAISTACFEGQCYANGLDAKTALIRSQKLINLLHETIKSTLVQAGIAPHRIFPPLRQQSPEMKIAGFLKQKDQDVCVVPQGIFPQRRLIDWGPLRFEPNSHDEYGQEYSERTLVINIRSQLSSVAKNTDTLFERTFAESVNLHKIYPRMVLGEAYLIPVYEYADDAQKENRVEFKTRHINIGKYISFFSALNMRDTGEDDISKYEKAALIVVDFSRPIPKVYNWTSELIADGLVAPGFPLELHDLSFETFIPSLLEKYTERFS